MMMRMVISTCFCLLLCSQTFAAMPTGETSQPTLIADNDTWIDANNLLMFANNTGWIAYDVTALLGKPNGLYYPFTTVADIQNGSNDNSVVYASGLWVGALDNTTGDTLICLAEYSNEYSPGPMVSGGPNPNPENPEFRVYKLYSDSMAQNPNQDYLDYLTYAVPQGAPLNNQGEPDIIGDQFLWSVYNDADPSQHDNDAGSTAPIGLEIRQSVFAFDRVDALGQVTFVRYRIFNNGTRNLSDMFISLWSDPDLGDAGDDLVGCDTLTSVGYCYNATNSDTDYGSTPPCIGYDLLQSPLQFTGNSADTGRMWGTLFSGYQNLKMGSFNKYINSTDPDNYRQTYQYMAGLDAAQGGIPLPNGTKYAVPGDPVAATGDLDSNPSDRRFMLSNGPLDLASGDSTEIIVAIMVGQGADRLSSISAMRLVDEVAQAKYDSMLASSSISVSPNSIDFGSVSLGNTGTDTLLISNTGNSTLTVTNIVSSSSLFVVDGSAFDLLPTETRAIPITFTPDAVGNHICDLSVYSNDPSAPISIVTLTGEGVLPPDISVSPLSLSSNLFTGESEIQFLTITNSGAGILSFTLNLGPAATFFEALGDEEHLSFPSNNQSTKDAGDRSNLMALLAADSVNLYYDDMETPGAWTHYPVRPGDILDLWEHTTSRAHSGSSSWHVSQHAYDGSDALQSPPIDLSNTQDATLTFMHWYEFDDCYGDPTFEGDGGIVEISLDGGNSWTQIYPVDGYPYVLDDPCSNPLAYDSAYAHDSEGGADFVPAMFDLTPYVGNVVHLRFHAGWDCGNCESNEGWYIDDVAIYSGSFSSWLTTDIIQGTIPSGSSIDVAVTFDAFGLLGGDYDAIINVLSNDPDQPSIDVPSHLTVTGTPDIQVTPTALDFGSIFVGASTSGIVTITNVGTDILTIAAISTGTSEYNVTPVTFSLAPSEYQDVFIEFSPLTEGLLTTDLTILSDDADEPSVTVGLSGTGLIPPEIAVSPDSIGVGLFTGETTTRFLTISNNGGSDLMLDLSVELASGGIGPSPPQVPRLLMRLQPEMESKDYPVDVQNSKSIRTPSQLNDPTPNDLVPYPRTEVQEITGIYSGDYMTYGITDYGEIMPFQFPIGNEHLQNGAYISGYTIAYNNAGVEKVAWAGFESRNGMTPISFTEIENTPSRVIVEVITQTSDGALRITRTFTIDPSDKYIKVQTNLENIFVGSITSVVFKSFADWDNDGDPGDDNWDYDLSRNMIYAWDINYTAIATNQIPDLMDINGWEDYSRRSTIIDYPIGPVFGVDGLEILHFELGDLFSGEVINLETVYAAGADLAELQAVVDRGLSFIRWIEINPETAVIPAGTSQDFAIIFDASGLYGGDYLTNLLVSSNDVETPEILVPLYMQVTGAPDISVSANSINFDPIFLGVSATDSFLISNIGTDQLIVSSLSSDNADYSVDVSSFQLAPLENKIVNVFFAPSQAGVRNGTLTIASNDPDTPSYGLQLSGLGVEPPIASVDPLSLEENLFTNQTSIQYLTLSNSGGSDLIFNISRLAINGLPVMPKSVNWSKATNYSASQFDVTQIIPSFSEPDESITQHSKDPVTTLSAGSGDSTILIIQESSAWGLLMNDFILSDFGIASTVINSSQIGTTDFTQFDLIITVGDESPSYYNAISSNVAKFDAFVSAGGIVQYQLATQGSDVSIVNGVNVVFGSLDNYNRVLIPEHPIVSGLPETLEGNYANHSYLTNLPVDAQIITQTSSTGLPTTVEYQYGNGRVIATGMTWEFLATRSNSSSPLLFNALSYSLSLIGAGWISIDPSSGLVPAGSSVEIGITFDATDLFGGDYTADVAITTNDPVTPELTVPTVLHVTGVPDIALSAGIIDFETVFVGYSRTDSVEVINTGTDLLVVSSITIDNAVFSTDALAFNLDPGEIQTVRVTYSPTLEELTSGTLTFNSNDPDQPAISVVLSGEGLHPPIISTTPGFFDEHMIQSMSQTINRTLTINNTGGSDLVWDVIAFMPTVSGKQTYVLPPLDIETQDPDVELSQVPTGSVWSQTDPLIADLLDLTGVKILVDQFHGNYSLSQWSSIISDLQMRGATIDESFTPVTSLLLSDYDILWLGDVNTVFSPAEQTALHNWLIAGNSILMEGDNTSTVDIFNSLLTYMGAGINYNSLDGFGGVTGNIFPHETTSGVDSIFLSGNVAHLQTIEPPADTLVVDIGNRPNTAYSKVGAGRIVVMADEITMNSHFGYANNRLFGNQVFDWLSNNISWLSFLPASGIVPQNSNSDITVHFNGEGLESGDYFAEVRVSSNDPATAQLDIPVHMRVDPYLCGDANLDGMVNIHDLDLLRAYYFICGPNPQPLEASDVDCDGSVGLADILSLAKYINSSGILNCCD